ncbi:hypothetical protein [Entomoplasma ellychniae]|uniref:hypothetical protein n=1 Tax=Entomoplasma ellychniae TaxID=2114 RepID=UPI000CE5AB4D|nr:hypothetical protein [Entomoplasma ellychniae]
MAKKIMEDKSVNQQDFKQFLNESILDSKSAHPLQPRKNFFGECVQIDASIHNWKEKKRKSEHYMLLLTIQLE